MTDRGSDKLFETHATIDKATLSKLVAIGAEYGEIKDWCQYGQPAIDRVCGKILVNPKLVGKLVTELVSLDHPRIGCDVFPLGKPGIDGVLVQLEAGLHR